MNRHVFITADTRHCQYVNMKTGITTSINVSMTNLSLAVFLTLLLTPRDIQTRTHKHICTCIILKHIAVSKIHFTQPSCCQLSLGSTAGERRMQWQPFSVNTIGHACLWILKYKKTCVMRADHGGFARYRGNTFFCFFQQFSSILIFRGTCTDGSIIY